MEAVYLMGMPMPPSANHCYFTVIIRGQPRRAPSKELRKYQKDFRTWCKANAAAVQDAARFAAFPSPLEVSATFKFQRQAILTLDGNPKKNDTSNRIKALHDCLAEAIGVDDKWFWSGSFTKRAFDGPKELERVNVRIRRCQA